MNVNRGSPGSNPICCIFEAWAISFTPGCSSSPSFMYEYLAIDSGGNISEYYAVVISSKLQHFINTSISDYLLTSL